MIPHEKNLQMEETIDKSVYGKIQSAVSDFLGTLSQVTRTTASQLVMQFLMLGQELLNFKIHLKRYLQHKDQEQNYDRATDLSIVHITNP